MFVIIVVLIIALIVSFMKLPEISWIVLLSIVGFVYWFWIREVEQAN